MEALSDLLAFAAMKEDNNKELSQRRGGDVRILRFGY